MSEQLKLGLLGNGISRTSSPKLHCLLGELIGRPTDYELMDLAELPGEVNIGDELKKCADAGFDGVNVTHPYKIKAFSCVDEHNVLPDGLRSINTVIFRDGKMIGDNTDFTGFCRGFQNICGADAKPGKVLQLGAGGVGVALAFGLDRLGAEEVVLYDRSESAASSLIELLKENGTNARLADEDLVAEMKTCGGLVNATPVGMYQYPGNPFPADGMGNQKWCFDAVYTPMETEFIQACRANNMTIVSGFQLFFFQGVNAFEKFSGQSIDVETALKKYTERYLQD